MEHFREGLVFHPQMIQPSPLQEKKPLSVDDIYSDISPLGHHSYGGMAQREGRSAVWMEGLCGHVCLNLRLLHGLGLLIRVKVVTH